MLKPLAFRNRVFVKVIALFVIVLAFASTLIAIFSLLFFQRTTHDMTGIVRAQSIRAIELSVVKKLDEYRNLMLQVIVDAEVRELLENLRDESYDNYSLTVYQLQTKLRSYSGFSSDVQAITVLDGHGRMISHDRTSQLSYNNHGMLIEDHDSGALERMTREACERQTILFIADERKPEGKSILHVAMPVWDFYNRANFGVIIITLDASTLWETIGSGAADRLAELFVVQRDGRFLVHPNYSMTGQAMTGYALDPGELRLNPVEYAGADEPAIPHGAELTVSRLGRYDLYLVGMIDPAMYNDASVRYTGYVIPMVLAITLISAALCFVVLGSLLRSIREVVREISRVQDGNLAVRIDIEPRDEIYTIAEAINEMLAKLEAMSSERDKEFLRYLQESERRRLAEARTLESQINSHFLYNTLNTISYSAIEDGSPRTSEMIGTLASCLRYTLDKSREMVFVRDEAEWIKMYLDLQKERQPSLFRYEIQMDPGVAGLPIQKMLLQPFAENAILHGFAGCKKGKLLLIRIGRLFGPERISISIEDNGKGIPEGKLREIQTLMRHYESADGLGIGIENVCFRLKTQYKSAARIYIRSWVGWGTKINFLLPVSGGKRPARIVPPENDDNDSNGI